MVGKQCVPFQPYYNLSPLSELSDRQILYNYQGHLSIGGSKDINGNWSVPSGERHLFYNNLWPNVSGYYPMTIAETRAPINLPCPSGSFKNIDGCCTSGTMVTIYDNYENLLPDVYGAVPGSLRVDINGISTAGKWYRANEYCDSLNGSYRTTAIADEGSDGSYDYGDFLHEHFGDLDYLGTILFNDDLNGYSNFVSCGYVAAHLYLFLAGDDPIVAGDGISPSGTYMVPVGGELLYTIAQPIVYRHNEIEVKPKIWLAMELVSLFHPEAWLPSGIPPVGTSPSDLDVIWGDGDVRFSFSKYTPLTPIRDPSRSKADLIYDYVVGESYGCSLIFAKPIGEYNGDYIVQDILFNLVVGYHDNAQSVIPYHPICSHSDQNYEIYQAFTSRKTGLGYSGDFDGENIDIITSFTHDDIICPLYKTVHSQAMYNDGARIISYGIVSGVMELPCVFNFNIHIYTDDTSDVDLTKNNISTQFTCRSPHLLGHIIDYCGANSSHNKALLGGNSLLFDIDNDRFYALHGTSFLEFEDKIKIYSDELDKMPYGSFAGSALVVIENAVTPPPYNEDVGYDYRDCTDCEDLNGEYRLTAPITEAESFTTIWNTDLPFTVGCPCSSGLCVKSLHLRIEQVDLSPHIPTSGNIPCTRVSLSLNRESLKYDSSYYNFGLSLWGVVARYETTFNNSWLIPSGSVVAESGRFYNHRYTIRNYGFLQPLSIDDFTNLELPLVYSDTSYVNNIPSTGINTICSLPESVRVTMFEAQEYRKIQPSWWYYSDDVEYFNNPNYGVLNRAVEYAYVTIPADGWTRTLSMNHHLQSDGTYCDEFHSIDGCGTAIYYDIWHPYDTPTCEQAAACNRANRTKIKCWGQGQGTSRSLYFNFRQRRSSVYFNCDNPDNNRNSNDQDEYNWNYCDDVSLDYCDEFLGGIDEMPQGTYACKLQGMTPSTTIIEQEGYSSPIRDFMDCGGVSNIKNIYGEPSPYFERNSINSWVYFNDPCNIFILKESGIIYQTPSPYWSCVKVGDPYPNNIPYTILKDQGGVDCRSSIYKITVNVSHCSAEPMLWEYRYAYDPNGYKMCYLRARLYFSCGPTPTFYSQQHFPTIPAGICTGANAPYSSFIDVDAISNVTLYPEDWFQCGGFYWPIDKGITLNLS
jgi:hypothetical protein